jgi:hypothetical protein
LQIRAGINHQVIVALTVQEILDEQIAKKLACGKIKQPRRIAAAVTQST